MSNPLNPFSKSVVSSSLADLISHRQNDQYPLHRRYLNPPLAKVQSIIGFDKLWVRGEGAYLWDTKGDRYLDLLSGYSVFNLGRSHPAIKAALHELIDLDRPNLVKMDCPLLAGLLAEELVRHMPVTSGGSERLEAVFFGNSGADAVDTALKFARAATRRPRVLFLEHAFHGLTLGTLSINGGEAFREGFGPLLPGFQSLPMDDLSALEAQLSKGDVAAFIVEPIQGKGVYIPSPHYLPQAQRLCQKYGALFICDEVQVGMGRTGRFLASEHWDLDPDIVTLSKSLSGGYVPVGATLTRRSIHDRTFSRLDRCQVHSTTFGQNDMAMAAGLAALQVLDEEHLVENASIMGCKLLTGLENLKGRHPMISEVRGRGLMIGIEFAPPSAAGIRLAWSAAEAAQKGLFAQLVVMSLLADHCILTQVGGPGVNIIKLLPPLIIGDEEVEVIIRAFDEVMSDAARLRGRVWGQSRKLIKQALSQ